MANSKASGRDPNPNWVNTTPPWPLDKSQGPRRFAVLLYRRWESIDVMGPMEALNTLSRNLSLESGEFTLDIITPGAKPASTAPWSGPGSKVNQQVVATHGYLYNHAKPKDDLLENIPRADFLLVPGGMGPDDDEIEGTVEFIRQYYTRYLEKQGYLFTVCTGSKLAAMAGCLNKQYATTNKSAYSYFTTQSWAVNTYWVADARWVDQGRIWTTSGVSAGTDGMIAWMKKTYGNDIAKKVCQSMEYNAVEDSRADPFCKTQSVLLVDQPGRSGLPAYKAQS